MKVEMLVCEPEPAQAPAARKAVAPVRSRVNETLKVILEAIQRFHSAPRQELLKAAKKQGYTDAEFDAALNYLVKTPVLVGDTTPTRSAAAKARGRDSGVASFDPYAAGERLVEELQAAEGGAWTGQELLSRFELTPATLHRRRKEHRIIYWRDAQHDFHYPKWQFTAGGALLPGIQEVLAAFESQDEWRIVSYFLGKRAQLADGRPLDWLRRGEIAKVLAHAKTHAEENTW